MSKRRASAGFSLLEVVVAFAILSLSLGVLYQIFSSAARQAVLAQEYSRALSLAESRLAEAAGLLPRIQSGTAEGELRWQRSVEPLSQDSATGTALAPYRITVEVRWGKRSLSLSTVRLGPAA